MAFGTAICRHGYFYPCCALTLSLAHEAWDRVRTHNENINILVK